MSQKLFSHPQHFPTMHHNSNYAAVKNTAKQVIQYLTVKRCQIILQQSALNALLFTVANCKSFCKYTVARTTLKSRLEYFEFVDTLFGIASFNWMKSVTPLNMSV